MGTPFAMHRLRAFEDQGGLCYYCLLPMYEFRREEFAKLHGLTMVQAASLKSSAEHLTAQRDGGPSSRDNIVAACRHCNEARHNGRPHCAPDPESFRDEVQRKMALGTWHPAQRPG